MPRPVHYTPRAQRRRAAIVSAAEALFAERGFDATRLEDVAERVEIRRASLVYYFRDKAELYGAVLEDLMQAFEARLRPTLAQSAPVDARIEDAVGVFVDFVIERPSFGRLLLREVADGRPAQRPRLMDFTGPVAELAAGLAEDASREDPERYAALDPIQLASTIAGATVFFVSAMPSLLPEGAFDPATPAHAKAHREQLLLITRRLIGFGANSR